MIPYTVYDYLTFILPGITVLFVTTYGWFGWPWHDPGGTALLGIVAAAFVVGNALTALANWLEPLFLGDRPGSDADVLWGQFASGDRYEGQRAVFGDLFENRYGTDLVRGYRLIQHELREQGKSTELDRLSQQIGFYRGMSTASLVSLGIEIALRVGWHTHLLPALWLPIFAISSALFIYRFRRFWRWYGDSVLSAARLLAPGPAPTS